MIKNKRNSSIYILAFLLPFWSFVNAIRNVNLPQSKNIIWLFVIFYGLNFTPSNREYDADGSRRIEHYGYYTADRFMNWEKFLEKFNGPVEDSYTDYVEPLLMYFSSKVSSDFHFLFGLYGLIGGYFFSRVIDLLVRLSNFKYDKYILPYFTAALLFVPFWHMQGFRFWLATIYFLWCILKYFETRKFIFLLLTIFTLTVHFSYTFGIIMIIFFAIVPKNNLLPFYLMYFVSLLISNIDVLSIGNFIGQFSSGYEYKVQGYAGESYKEVVNELAQFESNWYVDFREIGIKLITITFILISFFYYRKNISLSSHKEIFILSLIMLSMTNIVSNVPSMGRFYAPSYFILFYFILVAYRIQIMDTFLKRMHLFFMPILFIYSLVELRIGSDNFPISNFFTNWFFIPFYTPDTTLIDNIKDIFFL